LAPDWLGFADDHGISVGLSFVRTHGNVNSSKDYFASPATEFVCNAVGDGSHVRHGGNTDKVGIGFEIDRLHALVHDLDFDIPRSYAGKNREIQTRECRSCIHLHLWPESAADFEHLRNAENVVRIVWTNQENFHGCPSGESEDIHA